MSGEFDKLIENGVNSHFKIRFSLFQGRSVSLTLLQWPIFSVRHINYSHIGNFTVIGLQPTEFKILKLSSRTSKFIQSVNESITIWANWLLYYKSTILSQFAHTVILSLTDCMNFEVRLETFKILNSVGCNPMTVKLLNVPYTENRSLKQGQWYWPTLE